MSIIYIVFSILIFGFLIAIHEMGHCLVAKAFHIDVDEYSIGFGPLIAQKEKNGTMYSWRAIPFGGYCSFEEEQSDNPKALVNAKAIAKFCVYVAGSLVNFLAGFLAICLVFLNVQAFYSPCIYDFAEDCPLQAEDKLQKDDVIYKINGERVYIYSDISLLLSLAKDNQFDLVIIRDSIKKSVSLTMDKATYKGIDGQEYYGYGFYFGTEEVTFKNYFKNAVNNTFDYVRLVRLSLKMLFTGDAKISDLSGPIGVVSAMNDIGTSSASFFEGLLNIFDFGALIAINLAVMNLLPIPALDGGKILFLVINLISTALFKRKISEKTENTIHTIFLVFLFALMFYIAFSDVIKLWN